MIAKYTEAYGQNAPSCDPLSVLLYHNALKRKVIDAWSLGSY